MLLVFDVGGSRVRAGLSRGPGDVDVLGEVPTPADFDGFVDVLAGFLDGRDASGVAMAIAGVVDPETGRLKVANIPGLDGRRLADDLALALGLPVVVRNDADCFALAEAGMGAGQGHRSVFGIILGTGVGGGLVIDGRIVTGAGGYAGEWGHGPALNAAVVPWFPCGCGMSGCVDTVGGARGIERLHQALCGVAASSEVILAAWQAGDASAGRTVSVWLDLLSGPLAMVLNVVGSSVVPVGGGLANVPALIAALDGAVRARVLRRSAGPLLVCAGVAGEPGLVGASLAGWQG